MQELRERSNPFLPGEGNSGEPEAIRALRQESWAAFELAGIPTTRHEEWKYTSLRALTEGALHRGKRVDVSLAELESTPAAKLTGARLVFVNGRYVADLSDVSDLPEGVEAGSFQDAWAKGLETGVSHLGKVATLEGKLGSFNDERFVDLNTARFEDGAYLLVPRNQEAAVQIVFLQANDGAGRAEVYPRVLIILEENARADVSEKYIGLRGDCFVAPVTEVVLAPHATLNHVRLQLESEGTYHVGTMAATQAHDSTYRSTTAAFGAKTSRLDTLVWVGGEHAETSLNGVYVGEGEQVLDNHTRIDHAVPNCHSFEVYKGILKDKSQGVFNGKIFVYKDAQKTDAKQTNQALLLSKTAGVNTKPQLEIFADDVKCTHGATVGQLREDAMFYLRSRGIPESEARNILVYAFAAEVFEGIENEAAKNELERLLFEKLK